MKNGRGISIFREKSENYIKAYRGESVCVLYGVRAFIKLWGRTIKPEIIYISMFLFIRQASYFFL